MKDITTNQIHLQEWWMDQIRRMTKELLKQEEKRQTREKEKAEKKLGDYRTYNDIQEAYGVGVISAKKRDQLFDLLEKSQPEPDELYEMKKDLLSELYRTAKDILESMRAAHERERQEG